MDTDAGLAVAVVVRIGATRYVLGTEGVDEVVPLPSVTRVPGLPGWLAGVANWRGRVLAVVDLRSILGAAPMPAPIGAAAGRVATSGRLVVVSQDGVAAGLVVDDVTGVIDDALPGTEPVPATLSAPARAVLAGQVVLDGEPLGVLDVSAVLALRSQLDRSRAG